MISITIDGIKINVQKNITILQACSFLNIEIPKFCFQENLKIAGNCRMCLVEIENSPKPVASCAMPVVNNMKIYTNSPLVQKARESVLEFLLLNHPLDCPICDQASECDLQDQTMIFGSDRSRFFTLKRGVEDKNCGPFIKTIMTRCIHCTRCVRFINEVSNEDFLGTTGRGNGTEIGFYDINSFKSEFSGNLIDLCPVGALTSKPFSFKTRSWELKKKESIDILDAIGSNIYVDLFKNEIVRILPKTNFDINKEWISDKTRFFFDSLKYQRIEYPLLKQNDQTFKKISWYEAFNILNQKLINIDGSKVKGVVGDLVDLESLFLFKKNMVHLGINDISFLNLNKFKNINQINNDISSNLLFNNSLKLINQSDCCLILNSNIRDEASILNIHILDRIKKGNFVIGNIGPKLNFTYDINHLGSSLKILLQILQGKHFFCKSLKKAKNPIIIIGNNILYKKGGYFLIEKLKNLSFLNNLNINFLHSKTSFLNYLETSFDLNIFKNLNYEFLYLYNTDFKELKNIQKKKFIVYQGHHFTNNAQQSNLVLPSLSFLEKKGLYLNTEGLIQKSEKVIKLQTEQKSDLNIFKYLFIYLNQKNSFFKNETFNFYSIYPYIKKQKIKILKFNFKNQKLILVNLSFLNFFQKKLFTISILDKYSKILMKSKKFLKNSSNFKL